ncbi:hypothetical protein BH10PSE14_BH10PSE14_42640 [soil metagenome]
MGRNLFVGTALLLVSGAAQASSDAATRFGARENVRQVSLSPDGKHIAFVAAATGRSSSLFIVSTEDGIPKPILKSTGNPDQLQWCRWSTDTRLVCGIYMVLRDGDGPIEFSRLVTVNSTGADLKLLSARDSYYAMGLATRGGSVIDWGGEGTGGTVLMTRDYVAQQSIGNLAADTRQGRGVDRVDTTTLKRITIEQPRADAALYLGDGHGKVRIMAVRRKDSDGEDWGDLVYYYRKATSREWLPMSAGGAETAGFTPIAIDSLHDVTYGMADKGGRDALFSVALDGTLKRSLVLDRSDVDVDELLSIGRQDRVVGASYATERRQAEFFDPELRKLSASLSKALPGLPLVSFVDASADESNVRAAMLDQIDAFLRTSLHLPPAP